MYCNVSTMILCSQAFEIGSPTREESFKLNVIGVNRSLTFKI